MEESKNHHDLRQGTFSHKVCDKCEQDGTGLKSLITDDLMSIVRLRTCSEHDHEPVNFNVMLMGMHRVTQTFQHVIRGCSSHANYHWHTWTYLRPKTEAPKQDLGPLDSVEEVSSAFKHANVKIIGQALEWRESWLPRKYW
ncbi:hypothetical protein GCM10027417_24760 [Glutamicibacter endophyticus]